MMHRVLAAIVAGIAGFILSALILTVLDLYLSGHGRRALADRPLIDVDSVGVHPSVADAVAVGAAIAAAASNWHRD